MTTVAVLGPGAIGGLLAARLGQAGHDVTLIGRHPGGVTVAGLTLTAPGEDAITTRPASRPYLTHPVEVLIVAVKATQLVDATARVPAAFTAGATVIPFLNGVDHLPYLRAVYPAETVAGAIVVEATKLAYGIIEQASPFATITLAVPPRPGVGPPWGPGAAAAAAGLLDVPGLHVTTQPGELQVLWQKLCMLATFALLTTAAGQPIGAAREQFAEWLAPPGPRSLRGRRGARREHRPGGGRNPDPGPAGGDALLHAQGPPGGPGTRARRHRRAHAAHARPGRGPGHAPRGPGHPGCPLTRSAGPAGQPPGRSPGRRPPLLGGRHGWR